MSRVAGMDKPKIIIDKTLDGIITPNNYILKDAPTGMQVGKRYKYIMVGTRTGATAVPWLGIKFATSGQIPWFKLWRLRNNTVYDHGVAVDNDTNSWEASGSIDPQISEGVLSVGQPINFDGNRRPWQMRTFSGSNYSLGRADCALLINDKLVTQDWIDNLQLVLGSSASSGAWSNCRFVMWEDNENEGNMWQKVADIKLDSDVVYTSARSGAILLKAQLPNQMRTNDIYRLTLVGRVITNTSAGLYMDNTDSTAAHSDINRWYYDFSTNTINSDYELGTNGMGRYGANVTLVTAEAYCGVASNGQIAFISRGTGAFIPYHGGSLQPTPAGDTYNRQAFNLKVICGPGSTTVKAGTRLIVEKLAPMNYQELDFNARIEKEIPKTLEFDANIRALDTATLKYDAQIQKPTAQTIDFNAHIEKINAKTLRYDAEIINWFSYDKNIYFNSAIKQTLSTNVNFNARLVRTETKTLAYGAFIEHLSSRELKYDAEIMSPIHQTLINFNARMNAAISKTLAYGARIRLSNSINLTYSANISTSKLATIDYNAQIARVEGSTINFDANMLISSLSNLIYRANITNQTALILEYSANIENRYEKNINFNARIRVTTPLKLPAKWDDEKLEKSYKHWTQLPTDKAQTTWGEGKLDKQPTEWEVEELET